MPLFIECFQFGYHTSFSFSQDKSKTIRYKQRKSYPVFIKPFVSVCKSMIRAVFLTYRDKQSSEKVLDFCRSFITLKFIINIVSDIPISSREDIIIKQLALSLRKLLSSEQK